MKKQVISSDSNSEQSYARSQPLPQVGDPAPSFDVHSQKGILHFPEYSRGCWCILFVHPANFTSAWTMYSTFLALKERWFNARNTKLIALSNEQLQRQNGWSEKVRRYIGIYLGAPVIEDLDYSIANQYGITTKRRKSEENNRVAFIIDPEGIIRLILDDQQPSVEYAIINLEQALDRLQGKTAAVDSTPQPITPDFRLLFNVPEQSDLTDDYKLKPAYFKKDNLLPN